LKRVRLTTVAVENKCVTYFECVPVALIMQLAVRMGHIILSSVACPALPHCFPLYLINGTIFGKKLLNTKCVF